MFCLLKASKTKNVMKQRLTFLILSTVLIPHFGYGQSLFQTSFEKINLGETLETSDGAFISAGWNFAEYIVDSNQLLYFNQGVALIKTSFNGDTLWSKIFSVDTFNDFSRAEAISITADNGYLIGGGCYECPTTGNSALLIRTDQNGDTLWTKKYDVGVNPIIRAIRRTNDGNYIIAGHTGDYPEIGVLLMKIRDDGSVTWARKIYSSVNLAAYSILENADGSLVIIGNANYGSLDPDIMLIKTDANGQLLWTRFLGESGYDLGFDLCRSNEGGYILCGGISEVGFGSVDVCLIGTDDSGNVLWSKLYGGDKGEDGHCITPSSDGGYIVGGQTSSFIEDGGFYMLKTDHSGNLIWSNIYNDEWGLAFDIIPTSDGGYLATGEEVELLKISPDGESGCEQIIVPTIQADFTTLIKEYQVETVNIEPVIQPTRMKVLYGLKGMDRCFPSGTKSHPSLSYLITLKSNPVSDLIEGEIPSGYFDEILLTDLDGRILFQSVLQQTQTDFTFDVSDLIPGIYFLVARSHEQSTVKKVVKL